MHVADLTLFFAPHSGGVKRYLLAKHHYFNQFPQWRHSLIVPGAGDAETAPGIFEMKSLRIPGAAGYRLPLSRSRWRRLLNRLAPDVIEAGDPYHLAWTALAAADDMNIPAVAFAHSDVSRVLSDHLSRFAAPIADAYLRNLYARFDLVMAPSRSIAERLRRSGVHNIVVQPLGVDGDIFHPDRRDEHLRSELGIADDTRLLVFAGRMAPEKQIPLLVDALARLGAGFHLLLIGGEKNERVTDNVSMLVYQQDSVHLARLLASADALVHAGSHETFGLIAAEAMACGIPVVGLRCGALVELIDDDVGVLADANDAASFANAIQTLFTRDWKKMGVAARARVEKVYTWKSTFSVQVERYARLIQRLPDTDYADAETAGAR